MAGCKFAKVERALNYRRYQSGRKFLNLRGKCQAELISQEKIFSDPRCPIDIQSISKLAYSNTYRIWGFVALMQEETELGQYFLREAIRLNPALLDDKANELVKFFAI